MYVISLTFVKDTHDAVACKDFPLGAPKGKGLTIFLDNKKCGD